MPRWPLSTEDRFWSYVQKSDDCWTWTGTLNAYGYGVFWINDRLVGAHRVSYEYSVGPILGDLFVLHNCDNTECVNPSHLRLGTPADNTQDMLDRGRAQLGEANPAHKLTEQNVRDIRVARQQGVPIAELVAAYGVVKSAISNIATGKSWKHVQ
jgi:hypothetical protein